jgi:hypothetical protein
MENINKENDKAQAPAVAETALQNSEQNSGATDGCQQRSCSVLVGFAFIVLIAGWFIPSMTQIQETFQNLLANHTGWFVLYQLSLSILMVNLLNSLLLFLSGLKDMVTKTL